MTKRERIASRWMTFAAGVLLTSAALGQEYPPPTIAEGPPKVVVGLISGVTEGFRRRFAQLREDTDRSKVMVMSTALGIGAFLGLVGLAPAVPAFTGWPNVQGVLGGVTCGLLTAAGVSFLKGLVGMREEKRAAAGAP
jgi:hypothetical protein